MLTNLITLQAEGAASGGFSSIIMIVALVAVFYFLMIRPQQKKQKEIKKFREGLKKGDSVITAGGIYGRIREVRDTTFMVSLADNLLVKIDKGSVYPSAGDAQEQQAQQQQQPQQPAK